MNEVTRGTVLVVAEVSAVGLGALEGPYTVRTGRTVDEGCTALDGTVDALVVEEQLPDGPGRTLLEEAHDRGLALRTGLLTRVVDTAHPEFDTVVGVPPSDVELREAVEYLLSLSRYDDRIDRLYSLAKRRSRDPTVDGLVGDGGFDRLDDDLLAARTAADEALFDVDGRCLGAAVTDPYRTTGSGEEQ